VGDSDYDGDTIVIHINSALREIASRIMLPELLTSATVTTHSDAVEDITLTPGSAVAIQATGHGRSTGDRVIFAGVGGTTELNGNIYTITVSNDNNFTLDGTDGDDFTAWTSGGNFYCPSVSLPSDYHRGLHGRAIAGSVYSKDRDEHVKVYESFTRFLLDYDDLNHTGSVEGVCAHGGKIWYQYVPTSPDTLTLYYYRVPDDSADNSSYPDGMPAQADEAIIYHCLQKIAESRQNWEAVRGWKALFEEEMTRLSSFYGPDDKRAITIRDKAVEKGF